MAVYSFEPEMYYYTFGPHEPALRVRDGDTVITETRDAFGLDAERRPIPPHKRHALPGGAVLPSNPLVGPVFVEDARRGDLLAVSIDRIRLTRDFAVSKQSEYFGSLTGESPGRRLLYNPPVPSVWYEWKLDLERNVGILEMPASRIRRVEAPLAPFIGSIGTAPPHGRTETTLTPGEYGGNMDYRGLTEGVTLYLPVWVDGAYLFFGDVHALQGDGEMNGTALEVTAEVTLTLLVVKGKKAAWPRIENATHIMTAGSTRPLYDCVRAANMELLAWLTAEYGFDRTEAWQLMGQVGTMQIANVVDPNFTVVAAFPKRYLP
jgi:acetamidase/formamidase